MARLSGLSSEHHHEGPGDAPRRKRGRPGKNRAPSQEVASSSSKRPASPSLEESHKRTKRVQIDDEDQIAEEMDQFASRSQKGDTINVEMHSTATTTRRPARRYSEPPVEREEDDAVLALMSPPATQPQPGLTPHLNRIGAIRRDAATTRRARMSLPAQLHISEGIDEEVDGTHFQYAPLSAVLDSRTRRRLRRNHLSQEVIEHMDYQREQKKQLIEMNKRLRASDEKIKELEYQLEAQRLGEIDISDDNVAAMELELEQAREEIDRLRASSVYNGSEEGIDAMDGAFDMSEDESEQPLMLVNTSDIPLNRDMEAPFIPNTKWSSRVLELSSQMKFDSLAEVSQLTHDTLMELDGDQVPDKIEDKAVERYERELHHYTHMLAKAQGSLRLITLALQNINYLDPGREAHHILIELRHGFDTLRSELEKLFPNTAAGLTNQELLHKIPELFGGIFFELKEKLTLIQVSQKTEVLLRRQYEGVLDLLGDSEERIKALEKTERGLNQSNEDKHRVILDLQERITTQTQTLADEHAALEGANDQITELAEDVANKDIDLQRLRNSLEKYRQDLDNVVHTSTQMETDYKETIARMEQDHADAIDTMQLDFNNEQEAREMAEADATAKGEVIDDLEGRLESLETEVNLITGEMAELRKRLVEQTEGRQAAEGQRDEQAQLAYDYANDIENLNLTIADLNTQLADAHANLGAERAQREQTEADLDDVSSQLATKTEQLHDAGTAANELRARIFGLQQEKDQTIAQLQQESQDREAELTDQLDNEMMVRETAEKTVDKLNSDIEQLQADLETLQIELNEMAEARDLLEQDREKQAGALNQQLIDLRTKYAALETSTNSTITSLQANITDLNNQVQRQQNEIASLKEDIADKELRYEEDTTTLQAEIADLNDNLTIERDENERNRKEIASLSARVENEANELLSMMNSHSEEITHLKTTIATQAATIAHLQSNAELKVQEHEETITEREIIIEELRLLGSDRLEMIVSLESSLETLKVKFAAQEQDARETIDALNLAHRRLIEENEAHAAAAKERFQKNLTAVQKMKVDRVEFKTSSLALGPAQNSKVVKTTEKTKTSKKSGAGRKRVASRAWRDSGFGMEDEEGGPSKLDNGDVDDEFLAV